MRAHYRERLKELVQLTYQKVSEHFVQQQGSGPSAVSTVTVMAQRMDPSLNIAASIMYILGIYLYPLANFHATELENEVCPLCGSEVH